MSPKAVKVKHVNGYDLEIAFSNGEKRLTPFWDQLVSRGGVFKPLEDVEVFKRVKIEPDFGTLVWPGDVDICPDVLYWLATGTPIKGSTDPKYLRPPPHLKSRKNMSRSAAAKVVARKVTAKH